MIYCIGNFDGVHPGHISLISQAKALGNEIAVLTFDPHPRSVFSPELPSFGLTNALQRETYLKDVGVTKVVTLPFTKQLAALTAEEFATSILRDMLKATVIVAGENFQFGKGRQGDMSLLSYFGSKLGFEVHSVSLFQTSGYSVSSTLIRKMLKSGNYADAVSLWRRNFILQSEVMRGDQLGRTLGFPTANLDWGTYQRPKFGVYASLTHLLDSRVLKSVTNLGQRPTVDGFEERFETHLFDYNEDLYGQKISVELISYIREEQRFDGLEALKTQIAVDCETAHAMLA